MANLGQPQKTRGGQRETWVADEVERDLLREILVEHKLLRAHLEVITDERINEEDV